MLDNFGDCNGRVNCLLQSSLVGNERKSKQTKKKVAPGSKGLDLQKPQIPDNSGNAPPGLAATLPTVPL